MELYQVRYFLAVAEHLSFTRAARALNLSQPPLSQQIRRLESEVGGKLFVRDTHSVRLSDLGAAFVPMARRILAEVEAATEELGALRRLEKGVLRIGASGALAYYLLPMLLKRFRDSYPMVHLEIVERRTAELLQLAEQEAIDVALIRLPHDQTRLQTRVLASEPLVVALPPAHPQAGQATVRLRDLADDSIILIAQRSEPFYRLVLDLYARHGSAPRIICAGAAYSTACRLVGLGMGVSILAEMSRHLRVDPMPAFARLDEPGAESAICLLSHPYSELTTPARAFFDLATSVDMQALQPAPGGAPGGLDAQRAAGPAMHPPGMG